jgi:hypothetical protein
VPPSAEKPSSDTVLYVFYDFEITQDTPFSDTATVQMPILVCVQQFCIRCKSEPDIDKDCAQCDILKHTFWEDDSVGYLFSYLCRPPPWANNIVAIIHNAKDFDLQFILKRAIL